MIAPLNAERQTPNEQSVLVTGVTGYIGGRLVPRLLEAGARVRCLARDASRLQGRLWLADVDLMVGDVLSPASLRDAMQGVAVAYYLVHSLGAGSDFPERDVTGARNFAAAAKSAGVERIIYLGGLGDPGKALSAHLRSRPDTGDALRESGRRSPNFAPELLSAQGASPSK